MIFVTTKIRRMPENCRECPYYLRSTLTERLVVAWGAKCKAKGGYLYGRDIKQHGGRPAWCPLREGKPAAEEVRV